MSAVDPCAPGSELPGLRLAGIGFLLLGLVPFLGSGGLRPAVTSAVLGIVALVLLYLAAGSRRRERREPPGAPSAELSQLAAPAAASLSLRRSERSHRLLGIGVGLCALFGVHLLLLCSSQRQAHLPLGTVSLLLGLTTLLVPAAGALSCAGRGVKMARNGESLTLTWSLFGRAYRKRSLMLPLSSVRSTEPDCSVLVVDFEGERVALELRRSESEAVQLWLRAGGSQVADADATHPAAPG